MDNKDKSVTVDNSLSSLVEELNKWLKEDPAFIRQLLLPVAVTRNSDMAESSSFQFNKVGSDYHTSLLGVINRMNTDTNSSFIIYEVDEDTKEIVKFSLMKQSDIEYVD